MTAEFRIGIMSALSQEAEEIQKKISLDNSVPNDVTGFSFGKIGDAKVVSTLSGMGKVNAAITAQKLISDFQVKVIIFTGVAGGIHPSLEIGDIVIARQTFQHDFGFLSHDFKVHSVGTLPELGIGSVSDSIMMNLEISGFAELTKILLATQSSLLPVKVGEKTHSPIIKLGTIATGDQFIANDNKKAALAEMGADAVEMEGAAVAQVGKSNNVPVVLIRSISDKAGVESHIDFQTFFKTAAANNAHLVVEAINSGKLTHLK